MDAGHRDSRGAYVLVEPPPPTERSASEGLDAPLLEALLPAGDGAGAGEQDGGDGAPGAPLGQQQQQQVGTAADSWCVRVAVQKQQDLAFIGRQRDSTGPGLVSEVSWLVSYHFTLEPSLSSVQGCSPRKAKFTIAVAWKHLDASHPDSRGLAQNGIEEVASADVWARSAQVLKNRGVSASGFF
jgi:hypothetical protein